MSLTDAEKEFSRNRSGVMEDDQFATTLTRALSSAELQSIERAQIAYSSGRINQREVAKGIWVLVK